MKVDPQPRYAAVSVHAVFFSEQVVSALDSDGGDRLYSLRCGRLCRGGRVEDCNVKYHINTSPLRPGKGGKEGEARRFLPRDPKHTTSVIISPPLLAANGRYYGLGD